MAIIQLVPSLAYGDAVGNDVLALDKAIRSMGYRTGIYAEYVDPRIPGHVAKSICQLPKLSEKDVAIYHLAIGSDIAYRFGKSKCKKVIVYHNITPPHFFENYNLDPAVMAESGLTAAKWLADKVDYCLADSEFNKQDLIDMGYRCPIDVLPILIPFADYDKEPDEQVVKKYQDGYTNILFTGRIAPNKCQEDVIKSFAHYQKYYNPKSRLILIGSDTDFENYKNRLERYAELLGVKQLVLPGHVKFNAILGFYRAADLFLCQSEHEGFCVPLVEAMYFQIPIIAYNCCAIAETLGGGGILLEEKNAVETAGVMDYVLKHRELRDKIAEGQKEQLKNFAYEAVAEKFSTFVRRWV